MFSFLRKSGLRNILDYYKTQQQINNYSEKLDKLSKSLITTSSKLQGIGVSNLSKTEASRLHKSLTKISVSSYKTSQVQSSILEKLQKSMDAQLKKHPYLSQLPTHITDLLTEVQLAEEIEELTKSIKKDPELAKRAEIILAMEPVVIDTGKEVLNLMAVTPLAKSVFADALVTNGKGKLLLIQRNPDDDLFPGVWGLPGGHVEEGEAIIDAALRELKEETNVSGLNGELLSTVRSGDAELNYVAVSTASENFHHEDDHDFTNPMILDADETVNYQFVNAEDLDQLDLIPGLKENLLQILSEPLAKGLDKGRLVKKRITVTRGGKTFQMYKWVRVDGDDLGTGHTKTPTPNTGDDSADVNNILNMKGSAAEKLRHLVNFGITDKKSLMAVSGASYQQVRSVIKSAGVENLTDGNKISVVKSGDVDEIRIGDTSISGDEIDSLDEDELETLLGELDIESLIAAEFQSFTAESDIDYAASDKPNKFTGKDKIDSTMDTFINMVVEGKRKLAVLYGLGGVGKTYQTKQVLTNPSTIGPNGKPFGHDLTEYDPELDPSDEEYDFIKITGKITGKRLYETMYEHNGKIIMLDDADSIFDDPVAIDLMKGSLDTTLETITYKGQTPKIDGEAIPTSMKFNGGVIIISNLTNAQLRKKGAGPLIDSRGFTLDTSRTMSETIDKLDFIKDKIEFEDNKGNPVSVSGDAREAAISMIKANTKYLDIARINARTLGGLALLYDEEGLSSGAELMNAFSAQSLISVTANDIKNTIRERAIAKIKKDQEDAKSRARIKRHMSILRNTKSKK